MSVFIDILITMRPRQWTKNLLVFAALLFAGKIGDVAADREALIAFVSFCILSGAVYFLNDSLDVERDRQHPVKCKRPIAAGRLPAWEGILVAGTLALLGLVVAYFVNTAFSVFFFLAIAYILLTTAYSLWLKHVVILDVLVIALGYVLRAVAGAAAIEVEISPWLVICTLLLTLFLALAKRRGEIVQLEDGAADYRKILDEYSPGLLDQMIAVVTASTVVTYCLYTVDDRTIQVVGTPNLVYTVPLVIYGIFRYLYLMHEKKLGGNPDQLLIGDTPLLVTVALYTLAVGLLLYFS